MQQRASVFLAAAPLVLAACVYIDGDVAADWDDAPSPAFEAVYAAAVADDVVYLTAASAGCTTEASFEPRTRARRGTMEVGFTRVRADRCGETKPGGVDLAWTFDALGLPPGARVIVENPIGR